MSRRAPRRNTGRRSGLTPELATQIVDLVARGNYLETSARACGVPPGTLWEWLKKGEDAAKAIAEGETLPDRARLFAEFTEAVARARADGEVKAVAVVEKVMEGGFLVKETPLISRDGSLVYGEDGEMLYAREYAQPDGKLALEYLSRTRPERYARTPAAQRVEVTGIDGGAVQVESNELVASLARRLSTLVAERHGEIERPPEDEIEGEIVEDDGD